MFCKYWKEIDDERGFEVEVCRASGVRKCYCCGETEQCTYLQDLKRVMEIDKAEEGK